ncbi:hypothetical protein CANARDRAFT_235280 [[Candida] arabinofermentans NRRL YB-2248]|uniref:DUF202 domain-containing protein n=1 Tax=[Candida] arabinofermentans NRRL YB-2248 TaxID=983967 RepID=A0A1E4SZ44_9ASCO|nr:hypothetical protein CANARDRAFT_235280 [[Candida] arabinofermentans NRRL YB-2248]
MLLSFLPASDLLIENRTSESRDILMTERTTLSWIKFSTVLSLAAVAIVLNYRIDTSDMRDPGFSDPVRDSKKPINVIVISCLFAAMSLGAVLLSGYNYFRAIYNYKDERIETLDNKLTSIFLTVCIVTLLAINVTFMIVQ